jgi:hypothetical protein
MGFDGPEAGNLTALKNGFQVASQSWTIRELARLLFLRELIRAHGVWSGADDRSNRESSEEWRVPQRRDWDIDQPDGRVTLLSLFRGIAGPTAKLDALVPKRRGLAGAIDQGQEGGQSH